MTDERRRYFRITDTVGVAYRVLSTEELSATHHDSHPEESIHSLLASYDTDIDAMLEVFAKADAQAASILSMLNKKINALVNQLEMENRLVERIAHKFQEVNISACGIAFHVLEELQLGQVVSLDIALYPSEDHVYSYGSVVGVEPSESGKGFYVRVNFSKMSEADKELLIQHIVKRQSVLIREFRGTKH